MRTQQISIMEHRYTMITSCSTSRLLLFLIIPAITVMIAAADDLFLLSGQSNMDGYATRGQSLTGNADYWLSIKSILTNGTSTMKDELYNVIYEANQRKSGTMEVANTLTNELMHLYDQGLLHDLDAPLTFGKCSFVKPKKNAMENCSKLVEGVFQHPGMPTVAMTLDMNGCFLERWNCKWE
eukprot:scaffold27080_cov234-Skeletonema_menzelii.AAC.4